ncbi:MAG: hypothetical protein ACK55I_28300, partial [bacterium]
MLVHLEPRDAVLEPRGRRLPLEVAVPVLHQPQRVVLAVLHLREAVVLAHVLQQDHVLVQLPQRIVERDALIEV